MVGLFVAPGRLAASPLWPTVARGAGGSSREGPGTLWWWVWAWRVGWPEAVGVYAGGRGCGVGVADLDGWAWAT